METIILFIIPALCYLHYPFDIFFGKSELVFEMGTKKYSIV